MGSGPSSAYPTFTSATVPGASDMNRIARNDKIFKVQPAGRFLSYETLMAAAGADGSTWYNLRYNIKQYDVEYEGGILSPDLATGGSGFASTFNINTSGIYSIKATQRGSSGSATGWYALAAYIVGGSALDEDIVSWSIALSPWTCRIAVEHYLSAGQQIQIRHRALSGQNVNLDTNPPGPFLAIRKEQDRDV